MSNDDIKRHIAEFRIGDGVFRVFFKKPYYDHTWSISFDRNGTFDLTRTGSAYLVMSTVVDIITEFITKYNPRLFHFEAKNNEKSRLKLYPRLAAVVGKKFPQYTANKISGNRYERHQMQREAEPFVPTPKVDVEEPEETNAEKQKRIDDFFAHIDRGGGLDDLL